MRSWRAARRVALTAALCWAMPAAPLRAQDVAKAFAESSAHFDRNEYAAAIAILATIPETVDPKSHVRKHLNTAQALMNLGRHIEALPHIDEARGIARQNGDIAGEVNVEMAQGNYHRWSRHRGDALRTFERAVQLAEQAGDRRLLSSAYSRLAVGYRDVEDWARGMHFSDKSFELRKDSLTITDRFNRTMDRGIAYFEMYDRDAAEAAFLTGLELAVESRGLRNESFAQGELGYVYWAFDKNGPRALEHYERAIALANAADVPDLQVTWRLNRANVYRETGEHARAIAEYDAIVAFEKARKFWQVSFVALKNTGQTYRLMGRFTEARNLLETILRERPNQPSPRHIWQAHMELASTYEALGQNEDAEKNYRAMLDVLEEQRNTAIFDAFRTGSFAHSLNLYDPYERYIRFLTRSAGGAARVGDAFRVSEKARARGFLEMLASVRSTLAATMPPALLAEEARVMRAVSAVQQKLRAEGLSKETRETLLAELTRHERDRDAFRLKLRVEHPSLAETRYPEVGGPSEVQPAIRAGETVVSFFLSEPESFRWTLSRGAVTFDRLPGRARIEAQAARLRQLIRAPGDVAAAQKEADALAGLLLSGLDLPQDAPLVIVPHGALHYVPFEVLERGGQRLIERHAISYAPSVNAFAYLRRVKASDSPFRVLAVGAPEARAGTAPASARTGDVDNIALLGPLPFAGEEVQAIRRMFPNATETLTGADARETALRRPDLGAFQVLHFATHGLVSDAHPSRSGLLFSPEAGEDGLLQMGEIYRLGLRSELVVLSACQTALGREITGEGIVGLTRAFFHGGSRAVMAALWNLNDRFAAEFVGRFYGELRAGRLSEEALRAAKLAYLNDARYGHPFYWASLVLAGDGTRALYTPRRWTSYLPWAALVALALIAAGRVRARRLT